MIVPPPVMTETLATMSQFAETDEELDLLASLAHVNQVHEASLPENLTDPDGDWGDCTCCQIPFPCRMWVEANVLAVEWLSRRAGEACRRAREHLGRQSSPGEVAA